MTILIDRPTTSTQALSRELSGLAHGPLPMSDALDPTSGALDAGLTPPDLRKLVCPNRSAQAHAKGSGVTKVPYDCHDCIICTTNLAWLTFDKLSARVTQRTALYLYLAITQQEKGTVTQAALREDAPISSANLTHGTVYFTPVCLDSPERRGFVVYGQVFCDWLIEQRMNERLVKVQYTRWEVESEKELEFEVEKEPSVPIRIPQGREEFADFAANTGLKLIYKGPSDCYGNRFEKWEYLPGWDMARHLAAGDQWWATRHRASVNRWKAEQQEMIDMRECG